MLVDRFTFRFVEFDPAEFETSVRNTCGIESQLGEQLVAGAMLDESIGNTQSANSRRIEPEVVNYLEHSTAESALNWPSSTVTRNLESPNDCSMTSRSKGLANRALITPTSKPCSLSRSAALRQ